MQEDVPTLQISRDPEREVRQRTLLVNVLRALLMILLGVITALGIIEESNDNATGVKLTGWWWAMVGFGVLLFALILAVDILTPRRKLSSLSAIIFGVFAGVVLTVAVGVIIDYLRLAFFAEASTNEQVFATIKLSLGVGLCYLGAATILQTQDDFRLVIPYVEFAKQIRGPKPFILDTSALIDGRMLSVGETGLLQTPLIVPTFVIEELHKLSDSEDKLKRARGRRGLDILSKLQKNGRLDVTIEATPVPGKDVDQKLVELAKDMPGTIVTTDSGLTRVAQIQNVASLNVHDLAGALKPSVMVGQQIRVELIKKGEQDGQAVGYLPDGTMVVAEDGESMIGLDTHLEVSSTMQTSAGRLIFARVRGDVSSSS